ncbi:MAG: bis(5'-nucleosyl)-tetraphosphatase (symmetrical) YqeK [Syntrophomonadaceae bacterium]
MITADKAIKIIRSRLSEERFNHSLRVAQAAQRLSESYALPQEPAYLAGLLHDYAKGLSGSALVSLAEENGLITENIERLIPDILHAPVGAFLVEKELGVDDTEILKAIRNHTLGEANMGILEKIIYLADMMEPGRDYPGRERLECLAFRSLDEAMLFGLESTIKYCVDRKRLLHPKTVDVRNFLLLQAQKGRI